jgi:hypothetical protein
VFSASNDLSTGIFWPNFGYQRKYESGLPVDLSGNPVPISVDPFFVRVKR